MFNHEEGNHGEYFALNVSRCDPLAACIDLYSRTNLADARSASSHPQFSRRYWKRVKKKDKDRRVGEKKTSGTVNVCGGSVRAHAHDEPEAHATVIYVNVGAPLFRKSM